MSTEAVIGQEPRVAPGLCLAIGATNARIAYCAEGGVGAFRLIDTPTRPRDFFMWMAHEVLNASHDGREWAVAGFPGPVNPDDMLVGPMINVRGMAKREYDLHEELIKADPAVGDILDEGFILLAVNDGALAAQAAADVKGEHKYGVTAALIAGTGVGAGVAIKDPNFATVHRTDRRPNEIGHIMLSDDPTDTFEASYSGPGIKRRWGDPKKLPIGHPAWEKQGQAVVRISMMLALMSDVELVVATGGVNAGASNKYRHPMKYYLEDYQRRGNDTQRKFIPEIKLVEPGEADVFEIYGAEGVMRDFLTADIQRLD